MDEKQLAAKVAELKQALDGMPISDVCVIVGSMFSKNPEYLQAVICAIWHIGECMNAGKVEIKPTKTGIGLNFVAKRGQSLDLQKGR